MKARIALLVLTSLVAAACGGSDGAEEDGGDTPATQPVSEQDDGQVDADQQSGGTENEGDDPQGDATAVAGSCTADLDAVGSAMSSAECDALVSLYNATAGPGWTDSSGWLSDSDPCTWYAITCGADGVTAIELTVNELQDSLPTSIGDFPQLSILHLNGNNLVGEIPASIGNLTALTSLALSANAMTGPIPAEIGNLVELENMTLFGNQFTELPSTITALTKLSTLSLDGNALSGPIPSEISQLSSLSYLGLNANSLSGPIPAELANLSELSFMYLGQNDLSGQVPDELLRFTELDGATLDGNGCLTASDDMAAWLDDVDPDWNDGC